MGGNVMACKKIFYQMKHNISGDNIDKEPGCLPLVKLSNQSVPK